MSEKKVISMLLHKVDLRKIGEQVERSLHQRLRARVDDAIQRVEAAKAREREAKRKRVIVDDFVKRRAKEREPGAD